MKLIVKSGPNDRKFGVLLYRIEDFMRSDNAQAEALNTTDPVDKIKKSSWLASAIGPSIYKARQCGLSTRRRPRL